jgi:hypothetical protein
MVAARTTRPTQRTRRVTHCCPTTWARVNRDAYNFGVHYHKHRGSLSV